GLVDTELGHGTDPVGIINQRRAVLDHRVHHRPPTHPELTGDTSDRSGVLTDLAARLNPCTTRQHGLNVDLFGAFRPSLRVTPRLDTTPPSLDPHQPRRATETRKVADLDTHPIVGLGAH